MSRVLNDKPGVSADTRQAVLTALDVLGYERPARLRKRSAGLVGLVVPELDNPIFPAFAQVIESVLAQAGYTPVLCTQTPGGVTEDEYVEMLLDRQVSGIVFVSGLHADTTADPERYRRLVARKLPDRAHHRIRRRRGGALRVVRRPGRRRTRRLPPRGPRAPAHRPDLRARAVRPGAAQGGRVPGDHDPPGRGLRGRVAVLDRSVTVRRRGWCGRRRAPARPGHDRDRLRLRPHGARRDPGGAKPRPAGAGRRVGGRVRRLTAHRVHRPAADHRAPACHGDGRGRRTGAHRRDQRPRRAAFGVRVPPGARRPGVHRRPAGHPGPAGRLARLRRRV